MGARIINIAGLILLAYTLIACSAGSGLKAPSAGGNEALQGSGTAFELLVMDQTFIDGGAGRVTHRAVPTEDGYAVEVSVVDAQNLKALFFEMNYDELLWHPVDCISTNLLSDEAQPVVLNQLSEAGLVAHGQVIRNYNLHEGFTGDGVLARIQFAPGAAGKEPAQFYDPYPLGADRVTIPDKSRMFVDHKTDNLRWYYEFRGDYDQNGEVNLADIAPLALHFGERAPMNGDPWPFDGVLRLVDGDSNGEINLADLLLISLRYRDRIAQYKAYSTKDYGADYPQGENQQHTMNPLVGVPFSEHKGDPATQRIWWERAIPGLDYFAIYWVQPVINGALGQPSVIAFEEETEFPRFEPLYDLDYQNGQLSWHFNLRGDGDHNCEVNLSDLTSVILNHEYDDHAPYQLVDPAYTSDFDRDGHVLFDDEALVVSIHFTARINGFAVYASNSETDAGSDPQSATMIEPIALVMWNDKFDKPDDSRSWFSLETEATPDTYFWVKPFWSNLEPIPFDRIGARSEVIQIP